MASLTLVCQLFSEEKILMSLVLTKLLLKPSDDLNFNFESFVKKDLGINLEKGI